MTVVAKEQRLLIAMTIVSTPTGDQRGYWNDSAPTHDSFLMGPNFGRFMTFSRFQDLLGAFSLCDASEGAGQARWASVNGLVAAWNEN